MEQKSEQRARKFYELSLNGSTVNEIADMYFMSSCQGRCNHEPILNWPPWLNELQRTTSMNADDQTPTKLRQYLRKPNADTQMPLTERQ